MSTFLLIVSYTFSLLILTLTQIMSTSLEIRPFLTNLSSTSEKSNNIQNEFEYEYVYEEESSESTSNDNDVSLDQEMSQQPSMSLQIENSLDENNEETTKSSIKVVPSLDIQLHDNVFEQLPSNVLSINAFQVDDAQIDFQRGRSVNMETQIQKTTPPKSFNEHRRQDENEIPDNFFDTRNDDGDADKSSELFLSANKTNLQEKRSNIDVGKAEKKTFIKTTSEKTVHSGTNRTKMIFALDFEEILNYNVNETKTSPPPKNKDANLPQILKLTTTPSHRVSSGIKSNFFFSRGIADTVIEARKSDVTLLSSFILKEFYNHCNDGKGCFGDPKGCILQKSCEAVVSFQPNYKMEGVLIELLGRTAKYIAIGFSTDQLMGDDNVVECERDHENIRIYRSFNSRRNNNRLKGDSNLSNLKANYNNEWLYCSFLLKKKTTVYTGTKVLNFNLEKEKFHLFLARGNTAQGNRVGIGYHDLGTAVSIEKYDLMNVIGEPKIRKLFEKLHGISIIIAWIFILPISTFVIRYFKDSWVEKFIFGLSIWFAVHIILNGVVVGLTLASMLLIMIPFPTNGIKTSNGWNHHNTCALIMCIFVVIQISLGIGIYKMRALNCSWLSKIHSVIGHLVFFFSYAIIYMSKEVRHGLPCIAHSVLITWIVLYFVIHIIISCQVCYVDYVQGVDASRIYAFGGLLPAQVTNIEPEPPGGNIKKIMLGCMFTIGLLSASILAGMYGAGFADCVQRAKDSV